MAVQQLVEAECGAPNPLVQWTSHFSGNKPLIHDSSIGYDRITELSSYGRGSVEEEMVREFLGEPSARPLVPQTFNMASLMTDIKHMEKQDTKDPVLDAWVSEFGHTHLNHDQLRGGVEDKWVHEFVGDNTKDQSVSQWVNQYNGVITEEEQWIQEFQEEHRKIEDVSKVAREISSTVSDSEIQSTEFMDFINKLANNELTIEDNKVNPNLSASWANEYGRHHDNVDDGFWGELEKEWSQLVKDAPQNHPWLTEYSSEYKFTKDNPLKEIDNPFDKGLDKLSKGDLPGAVLLFEAAVQQSPDNGMYWQYLGTAQADNEQEKLAITALEKCLDIDPNNLQALMSLAVSYTNETLQLKACQTLRQWIKTNPKYTTLVPDQPTIPYKPFMHSFMTKEEHEEVTSLYIAAAQMFPDTIDPDIQVGLGVLFNLSNEYEKAVDCFKAALEVRPHDAMLWNKLGATLANGNKSDEAIHAYRQALIHAPGFTRCRYNLGISCMNLKAYKEATEHFITALDIQRQVDVPVDSTNVRMSEAIWSTLRLAILYLGRHDIIEFVDQKNLDILLNEFIPH